MLVCFEGVQTPDIRHKRCASGSPPFNYFSLSAAGSVPHYLCLELAGSLTLISPHWMSADDVALLLLLLLLLDYRHCADVRLCVYVRACVCVCVVTHWPAQRKNLTKRTKTDRHRSCRLTLLRARPHSCMMCSHLGVKSKCLTLRLLNETR